MLDVVTVEVLNASEIDPVSFYNTIRISKSKKSELCKVLSVEAESVSKVFTTKLVFTSTHANGPFQKNLVVFSQ